MPRAIWKGAITFGLVHVPVELYPAEERREFKFSMLDKRDFSPVGYKRYSKKTGKEVEWSDVVKGYEYEKDQYVVLTDEERREGLRTAAGNPALDRPRGDRASRHPDNAAPRAGRSKWTSADADHVALPRRVARHQRIVAAGR